MVEKRSRRKPKRVETGLTKALKSFRNENALRQKDVAESIGMSLSGYKAVEYGYFRASKETLRKLAKAMRTTPAMLAKAQDLED